MKIDKDKLKISKFKDMLKDKKGRAKLELSLYVIFFLIVIILTRISSTPYNSNIQDDKEVSSFINDIKDNYECNIDININSEIINYRIIVLGNNSRITRKSNVEEKEYYIINNKYYEEDDYGNYILTNSEEVYPYINYNYFNINNVKNFIGSSIKEDNIYKLKVSDIILNSNNDEYVTILLDEENKKINIDYTNLLKTDDNIDNITVNMAFNNINNVLSLE